MGVHGVTGGRWSSTRGKVLAGVRIGVPGRWVTPGLVDEVLAEAGLAGGGCGQRFRALPARLGVYFVLGLCLFSGLPYREVLRQLAGGLAVALRAAGWQVPASTALTRLRRRLGEKPFELLFWRLCGTLSPGTAPWSHICGLLAMAWDGTTIKVPASAPNVACFGRLHGKLAAAEKETAMQNFQNGKTKILVATTVVEVGVDVPNASVMVIEQAERFGLAQIHQLRGRVGRGAHQSYCILITGKLNDIARERIRTLVESNDGFYIAEMDMKLRGPGEFFGTKQSGIPGLRLADLMRDGDILEMARAEVKALIEERKDAGEMRAVARYVQENWQRRYGLVLVG